MEVGVDCGVVFGQELVCLVFRVKCKGVKDII